jgi:hypothetical protein
MQYDLGRTEVSLILQGLALLLDEAEVDANEGEAERIRETMEVFDG